MTLNDYCEYIKNPLAESKARVVILPPGEIGIALRQFYRERGSIELRLSTFVKERAWLPMPDEVFQRAFSEMANHASEGNTPVLYGISGYISLLTDENKRDAVIALRDWIDGTTGQEAVCFLRRDDGTEVMLKSIFANPRYLQRKQLVKIDAGQDALRNKFEDMEKSAKRAEVMLVGDDLAYFIPDECDTFQKYLQYTEEYPDDSAARRIVVASEGKELAGINADVRQIVCLRDFAREFYDVEDERLSEDALWWICERSKESMEKTLAGTLNLLFFRGCSVTNHILHIFDKCNNAIEREALLWFIKYAAIKESYLEYIVNQPEIAVSNFRSAYVTSAAQCLDTSLKWADERKKAILEADIRTADADILQFIKHCTGESTSRVAPWLNCGSMAEKTELLRRCAEDGFVSNAVKDVYPEAAAYLYEDVVFEDAELEEYFREYRELKTTCRMTPEFYEKARRTFPLSLVQSRDAMLQQHVSDSGCALLVVDAMGAEWMPMLAALARHRNIGLDSIAVGKAWLPTSTIFNKINWPDASRRLLDIKRFDNIAHNGAEAHETRRPEENLAAALEVIGNEVIPRVAKGLTQFERVLVTADHGSSRLAVLAWQTEPRLTRTLTCEADAEVADWRYRERAAHDECPPELEETLDGRYWVVRGYNRLPQKGGGQSFELHGGATLEERLVPVVIFSRTGQFVPRTKASGKRVQIVEKEDFDL